MIRLSFIHEIIMLSWCYRAILVLVYTLYIRYVRYNTKGHNFFFIRYCNFRDQHGEFKSFILSLWLKTTYCWDLLTVVNICLKCFWIFCRFLAIALQLLIPRKDNINIQHNIYSNSTLTPKWTVILYLKGQSHEIFDPRFFSWINPTWVTDKRVEIALHMVANSQGNSRKCVDTRYAA
jgi:hypothetical protein